MSAYFQSSIKDFLATNDDEVIAKLQLRYTKDGYLTQYTSQVTAWASTLPALRHELNVLIERVPHATSWHILLEYPLYRLRRRIDAVLISPGSIAVIEIKTGASTFDTPDKRQTEEYAQDLRDFHADSKNACLVPILWAFDAAPATPVAMEPEPGVAPLMLVGRSDLGLVLSTLWNGTRHPEEAEIEKLATAWNMAPYQPVPTVIEAATNLFAGHGVREIAIASAKNLDQSTRAILSIIDRSRTLRQHSVVFLTGVPGAGKTLAGLNVVHSAVSEGFEEKGDIVYLSGNTPLVVVLREALARDQTKRSAQSEADKRTTLTQARAVTRATVQHINDFLKEYVQRDALPPSGHVIVFDEAQRAWDARQGREKFNRDASEPELVLEIMTRHPDWSVTICLIGKGQEINDGEEGVMGWANAIERTLEKRSIRLLAYGPESVFSSARTVETLGVMPPEVECVHNAELHLNVPMRSFRSPQLGDWIERLIDGDFEAAASVAADMSYPLFVTRSLSEAKNWLRQNVRGERRSGLLASSGARRLRADGLGEVLSATDGSAIAHWYLNSPGDIRSSFALEVPANEYTSQGLELDFACLCWGGDLLIRGESWLPRTLSGNKWSEVRSDARRRFVQNSYRVLLSRAREGLVIWVPAGDRDDPTRDPYDFDLIAMTLVAAGARML